MIMVMTWLVWLLAMSLSWLYLKPSTERSSFIAGWEVGCWLCWTLALIYWVSQRYVDRCCPRCRLKCIFRALSSGVWVESAGGRTQNLLFNKLPEGADDPGLLGPTLGEKHLSTPPRSIHDLPLIFKICEHKNLASWENSEMAHCFVLLFC